MKTPETKVAESLVNLMDDHWFNPTMFGRYLAEQPLYTIDRVMEMIVSVISEQAKLYEVHKNRGESSEGLMLANELNECIKAYQEDNNLNNLKLPSRSYTIKKREEVGQYKFGWRSEELDPFNQAYTMREECLVIQINIYSPNDPQDVSTFCGFFVCVGMWAKFSIYES